jgi:hypothetical protein
MPRDGDAHDQGKGLGEGPKRGWAEMRQAEQ